MSGERKPPRFPLGGREKAHPLEKAALWALAVALAGALVVWAAGAVSGRIFLGAWPGTSFSQTGGVLVHLRSHLSDPAAAWPARQRKRIPGPADFYLTLAVLLLPELGTGVFVLRRRMQRLESPEGAGARWANRRDLQPLRIRAAEPGRLTLGRVDGQLVAAGTRQSVIVIGPTQSGKTTGFATPAILEWQGPVLATSVKSDLLRDTHDARNAIPEGNVWIYDPTSSTGYDAAGWTPLAGCQTWQGAQRTASWLVAAAQGASPGIENAPFWYGAAEKLLAPLLLAAHYNDSTMADVIRWLDTLEDDEVGWGLDAAREPAAANAFAATKKREERTRSNVYATAETVLNAYADPGVLDSARRADISADRFLDGNRNTLYLCAPAHEQRRLQPLFATLVLEIVAAAYERSARTGNPLHPPLLLVLDECANIAPLRDLTTLASTGAGQGIQLVSVFQDMAQIYAVYGYDDAATIVANHRAKVILSGIADPRTLDYVAGLLGDEEVPQIASTKGEEGRSSTTESVAYRSLAPAHVVREMKPGQGVLVYGHLPPAKIAMRPWFAEPELRRIAETAPTRSVQTAA